MIEVVRLPVDLIDPSPFNTRRFTDVELEELADSLKRSGQVQPIKVRPRPGGRYEIVVGERRWRAARLAGLEYVDAVVVDLSDEEVILAQWEENEARRDFTDYERALKLRQMLESFGCSKEELAQRLGRSRSWVANHLRLLELEGNVSRETLYKLFEGQARAILSAPENVRARVCRWVDAFTREHGEPPSADAIKDYIWQLRMEEEFREALGGEEAAESSIAYETSRAMVEEAAAEAVGEAVEVEGGEVEGAVEGAVEETPREFIHRTRELWPGATDEFLVDSLMSRFGLSEAEARRELEEYYREKYGPTAPKVSVARAETVKCPVCGRAVDALDIQVKLEELREFEPELPAWEWLLREVGRR